MIAGPLEPGSAGIIASESRDCRKTRRNMDKMSLLFLFLLELRLDLCDCAIVMHQQLGRGSSWRNRSGKEGGAETRL